MAITNGVFFKKGSLKNYLALGTKDANTFYITTDDGGIYLGETRLGNYLVVDNVSALNDVVGVENVLYYAVAENVLARWNGTSWVQVNAAGLTKVNQGAGDIVTGISVQVNAATGAKELQVSREVLANNATFSALANRVGEVEADLSTLLGGDGGNSIADMIAAAVDPVATRVTTAEGKIVDLETLTGTHTSKIEALEGRMDTAEGTIATLAGDESNAASVKGQIKAAKEALLGDAAADYNTLGKLEDKVIAAQAKADTADSQATTNKNDISALTNRVATNEGAIAILNGDVNQEGSVKKQIAVEVAKIINDNDTSDIDTLEEIASWIANDTAGVGALQNRLATAEGKVATLESEMDTAQGQLATLTADDTNADSVKGQVKAAKEAIIGDAAADYNTLGKLEDKVIEAKGVADGAASKATTNEGAIGALTGRVATNEGDIATLKEEVNTNIPKDIADAKAEVMGANGDAATVNTIHGLRAAMTAVEGVNTTQGNAISEHGTRLDDVENHLTWGSF